MSDHEPPEAVVVALTDHAVERFGQRVASRTGELDSRAELGARVARAWRAGRIAASPPDGGEAPRGSVYVADLVDRDVVFVCRHDRPRGELIVITLWERERLGTPRVQRRFTDVLREPRRRRPGR